MSLNSRDLSKLFVQGHKNGYWVPTPPQPGETRSDPWGGALRAHLEIMTLLGGYDRKNGYFRTL